MRATFLISEFLLNRLTTIAFGLISIYAIYSTRKNKSSIMKWRIRNAEEAVNEYDRVKQIVHSAPFALNAYIVLNINGKIVHCNERTRRMLGWTEDELLGTNISKIIVDDYSQKNFEDFKKNKTTVPDDITIEVIGQTKLGTSIPLEIGVGKWIDEDRTQWYFIVIMRDITHRKNTEDTQKKLHETIEEIRKLYHEGEKIGHVAFWELNCQTGKLEKFSPNFVHLFGIKGSEIHVDSLIRRVIPEDKVRLAEIMVRAKETKTGYDVEYKMLSPDGYHINTIYSIASAIKNNKGELLAFRGMARIVKQEKVNWI